MSTIIIRETGNIKSGYSASLIFEGAGQYDLTIINPFNYKNEHELGWYFEEWIQFSFEKSGTAGQIASSITTYGEKLFRQVFRSDFHAYEEYRKLHSHLSQIQIIIESKTPDFQSLHWEALKDEDSPRPLSIDANIIRRVINTSSIQVQVKTSPIINLLIVTARPNEEKDVAYRTISRPIIDLIQKAKLRVNAEILRPGTFEALSKHLELKGQGFYHILHFDVHGRVGTYEQIRNGLDSYQYTYQSRYGQKDLSPYEGKKAFIFFEGEYIGDWNPVDAEDLGKLLTGKGIPICILNSCQSGMHTSSQDIHEMSLGSTLIGSGMQLVVAMKYSVTVTAAKILMEQIYQSLFNEIDLVNSVRIGRLELYNCKVRQVYFNNKVDLEDWLLPVLYQNQQVDLRLRNFTFEEEESYYEELNQRNNYTPPPFGFIGRDLEILKIERLLSRHNCLLIRGMGGTGKTELLKYLQDWWVKTKFSDSVIYFSYENQVWSLKKIIHEIAKKVYIRQELANFLAMSYSAQIQKIAATLRCNSHIIILDNLESATGTSEAITGKLPDNEQEELRGFLALLVNSQSKLLFSSRCGEEWLKISTFKENIYPLQGLDPESRSILAENILHSYFPQYTAVKKIIVDNDFKKIMDLLEGYPMALEIILPNLRNQTPTEILKGLDSADIELDNSSEDKTTSILKCIEYSYKNLSESEKSSITYIFIFQKYINIHIFNIFSSRLEVSENINSFSRFDFDNAIGKASNWGLFELSCENMNYLKIHPILPFSLQNEACKLSTLEKETIENIFVECYQQFAFEFSSNLDKDFSEIKLQSLELILKKETPNLEKALSLCFKKKKNLIIANLLIGWKFKKNEYESIIKISNSAIEKITHWTAEEKEIDYPMLLDGLALAYLNIKNYSKSREIYLKYVHEIDSCRNINHEEKLKKKAHAFIHLGRIEEESGYLRLAFRNYRYARLILRHCEDKSALIGLYHQMSILEGERGNLNIAKSYLLKELDIIGDVRTHNMYGSIFHHLGIVCHRNNEILEAQNYYELAIKSRDEIGLNIDNARTHIQLGNLFIEKDNFEKASSNFKKALEIAISTSNEHFEIISYFGLSNLSFSQKMYEDSKTYLLKVFSLINNNQEETKLVSKFWMFLIELYKKTKDDDFLEKVRIEYVNPSNLNPVIAFYFQNLDIKDKEIVSHIASKIGVNLISL